MSASMTEIISELNTFTCVAAYIVLAISFIILVTLYDVIVRFTLVVNFYVSWIYTNEILCASLGALICNLLTIVNGSGGAKSFDPFSAAHIVLHIKTIKTL